MFKKLKTKTIIIGSVILMALVLLIGTTFAYFTARVVGNDTAKSTQVYAGIMSLRLNGENQISCNNLYPGGSCATTFSVENTGTLTTSYELDIDSVINDFEKKEELTYTLTSNKTTKEESQAPSIDEVLLPAVVISPQEVQEYTLTIHFKETGSEQNYNANKTFSGRIQIRGLDSSNYLSAKILTRKINTTAPDFSSADPVKVSKQVVERDDSIGGLGDSYGSMVDANKLVATDYSFNEKTGLYTLINPELSVADNSIIGKYTCVFVGYGKFSQCSKMYKINEVAEGSYEEMTAFTFSENRNANYTSNNDKIVGKGYIIDEEGYFVLTDIEENVSFDKKYIGYYMCLDGTQLRCQMNFRMIKDVDNTTVTKVDYIRSIGIGGSYLKSVDKYTSETTNEVYSKSGLYRTVDDDGDSYYFRGAITNNYVLFANNLWRIVRINGDGSIRLVLNESTGTNSKFNATRNDAKYVGYTYDNERVCTNDNPCISEYDSNTNTFTNNITSTNSTIKDYLEEWYKTNLASKNNQILLGSYCNDTTYNENGDYIFYNSRTRTINGTPSLQCPNTAQNYGGKYKLKIGLISADEANMAGIPYAGDNKYNSDGLNVALNAKTGSESTNYLYPAQSGIWHTISPSSYDSGNSGNTYNMLINKNRFYHAAGQRINYSGLVFPVINLKSDIQISGGDGSHDHPYVVE